MSQQFWQEIDDIYPSSGDEGRNDRIQRSREQRTNNGITRIQDTISSSNVHGRPFVSALSTIRQDPAIRDQLQRIENIWALNGDKILADVLYAEVTLAIVQAANAVATVGRRVDGEMEEEFVSRTSARTRTTGNFTWNEGSTTPGTASTDRSSISHPPTLQAQGDPEVDLIQLKR